MKKNDLTGIFHETVTPRSSMFSKFGKEFERECILFADRQKTRRIYCVMWTEDHPEQFRFDLCYKLFSYDDRSLAFSFAKYCKGRRCVINRPMVHIYDFKKVVDMPRDKIEFEASHSENGRYALELWKTFNTCQLCGNIGDMTFTCQFRGERTRICQGCLTELQGMLRWKNSSPQY